MTASPARIGDTGVRTDARLLEQGWERRHLADPQRAKEAIDLFGSMGWEVRAERLTPDDLGSGCLHCASTVCRSYVVIYVRKPGSGPDSDRGQGTGGDPGYGRGPIRS